MGLIRMTDPLDLMARIAANTERYEKLSPEDRAFIDDVNRRRREFVAGSSLPAIQAEIQFVDDNAADYKRFNKLLGIESNF